MKKIVLLIAMAIVSVSTSAVVLDFGIKASYISSVGFSNLGDAKTYTWDQAKSGMGNGFNAGVFARIGLGDLFYLQPEALYNFERKEFSILGELTDGTPFTADKLITASTLDVPVLVGVQFLDLKIVNFRLLAGPKLRFNLGSDYKFEKLSANLNAENMSENFRNATIGLEAGVGVEVLGKINLDVRYNLINEISKSTNWANDINTKYADPLNGFIVSVGYKIF